MSQKYSNLEENIKLKECFLKQASSFVFYDTSDQI